MSSTLEQQPLLHEDPPHGPIAVSIGHGNKSQDVAAGHSEESQHDVLVIMDFDFGEKEMKRGSNLSAKKMETQDSPEHCRIFKESNPSLKEPSLKESTASTLTCAVAIHHRLLIAAMIITLYAGAYLGIHIALNVMNRMVVNSPFVGWASFYFLLLLLCAVFCMWWGWILQKKAIATFRGVLVDESDTRSIKAEASKTESQAKESQTRKCCCRRRGGDEIRRGADQREEKKKKEEKNNRGCCWMERDPESKDSKSRDVKAKSKTTPRYIHKCCCLCRKRTSETTNVSEKKSSCCPCRNRCPCIHKSRGGKPCRAPCIRPCKSKRSKLLQCGTRRCCLCCGRRPRSIEALSNKIERYSRSSSLLILAASFLLLIHIAFTVPQFGLSMNFVRLMKCGFLDDMVKAGVEPKFSAMIVGSDPDNWNGWNSLAGVFGNTDMQECLTVTDPSGIVVPQWKDAKTGKKSDVCVGLGCDHGSYTPPGVLGDVVRTEIVIKPKTPGVAGTLKPRPIIVRPRKKVPKKKEDQIPIPEAEQKQMQKEEFAKTKKALDNWVRKFIVLATILIGLAIIVGLPMAIWVWCKISLVKKNFTKCFDILVFELRKDNERRGEVRRVEVKKWKSDVRFEERGGIEGEEEGVNTDGLENQNETTIQEAIPFTGPELATINSAVIVTTGGNGGHDSDEKKFAAKFTDVAEEDAADEDDHNREEETGVPAISEGSANDVVNKNVDNNASNASVIPDSASVSSSTNENLDEEEEDLYDTYSALPSLSTLFHGRVRYLLTTNVILLFYMLMTITMQSYYIHVRLTEEAEFADSLNHSYDPDSAGVGGGKFLIKVFLWLQYWFVIFSLGLLELGFVMQLVSVILLSKLAKRYRADYEKRMSEDVEFVKLDERVKEIRAMEFFRKQMFHKVWKGFLLRGVRPESELEETEVEKEADGVVEKSVEEGIEKSVEEDVGKIETESVGPKPRVQTSFHSEKKNEDDDQNEHTNKSENLLKETDTTQTILTLHEKRHQQIESESVSSYSSTIRSVSALCIISSSITLIHVTLSATYNSIWMTSPDGACPYYEGVNGCVYWATDFVHPKIWVHKENPKLSNAGGLAFVIISLVLALLIALPVSILNMQWAFEIVDRVDRVDREEDEVLEEEDGGEEIGRTEGKAIEGMNAEGMAAETEGLAEENRMEESEQSETEKEQMTEERTANKTEVDRDEIDSGKYEDDMREV